MRRTFFLILFALVITSPAFAEKLKVTASFSIIGDFVTQIGGEDVDVDIIVPENSDPHIYQPTPKDVRKVTHADLVFINGFGFEGWFERLINNAGGKGKIVTVTTNIIPRTLMDAKGQSVYDPHTWHDVNNALVYVDNIEQAFIAVRPDLAAKFKHNADRYRQQLRELHAWIKKQLQDSSIPSHLVVTTHDAFWYYGQAYGVTFISPVGISTQAEPSAAVVAQMIKEIRAKNIRAIFVENLSNRKLIEQIAEETRTKVDGILYADSLSDPRLSDSPAKTYIEMMRYNTLEIVKGLKS